MWERSKSEVNKMAAPVFCKNMNIYVAAPFGENQVARNGNN